MTKNAPLNPLLEAARLKDEVRIRAHPSAEVERMEVREAFARLAQSVLGGSPVRMTPHSTEPVAIGRLRCFGSDEHFFTIESDDSYALIMLRAANETLASTYPVFGYVPDQSAESNGPTGSPRAHPRADWRQKAAVSISALEGSIKRLLRAVGHESVSGEDTVRVIYDGSDIEMSDTKAAQWIAADRARRLARGETYANAKRATNGQHRAIRANKGARSELAKAAAAIGEMARTESQGEAPDRNTAREAFSRVASAAEKLREHDPLMVGTYWLFEEVSIAAQRALESARLAVIDAQADETGRRPGFWTTSGANLMALALRNGPDVLAPITDVRNDGAPEVAADGSQVALDLEGAEIRFEAVNGKPSKGGAPGMAARGFERIVGYAEAAQSETLYDFGVGESGVPQTRRRRPQAMRP